MSYERNFDYLHRKQIIYRKKPDQSPSKAYDWGDFYENGTYECYELFRSKAKINTYKSLKWHLLVLWYLNPSICPDKFQELADVICHRPNGFTTFSISKQLLEKIVYEVNMYDLDKPPKNKLRKIIFKDFSTLTVQEKLKIVGTMVGRSKKIYETDIYEAMLHLNDDGEKITIRKLSKALKCSDRTIYRAMNDELKKEKELLNQINEEIQCKELHQIQERS
tara:strand:- start:573 stop:1235 length:663 start_codon:yes stop_codon:yes gene_type:complete